MLEKPLNVTRISLWNSTQASFASVNHAHFCTVNCMHRKRIHLQFTTNKPRAAYHASQYFVQYISFVRAAFSQHIRGRLLTASKLITAIVEGKFSLRQQSNGDRSISLFVRSNFKAESRASRFFVHWLDLRVVHGVSQGFSVFTEKSPVD